MRICIVSRYHATEPSYAALDLADFGLRSGASVRWLTPTSGGTALHGYWDHRRERFSSDALYDDALQSADAVVWTHCPDEATAAKAAACGVKSLYLHSWDEAVPADLPALSRFDVVLAPHRASETMLSKVYALGSSVAACPWSPAPCSWRGHDAGPDTPGVLVWIDGPNQYNTSAAALEALPVLLDSDPRLQLTLVIGGAPGKTRRILAGLRARYGGRLVVEPPPPYDRLLDRLAAVDLLIYPAQFAGFGHPVLWAAAGAIPVVCFDCAPFGSVARLVSPDGVVECRRAVTEGGMAFVEDYAPAKLYARAAAVLASPARGPLDTIYQSMHARRRVFENALSQLFG